MEEFTGRTAVTSRPTETALTRADLSRYLADGTVLIHGKLTGVIPHLRSSPQAWGACHRRTIRQARAPTTGSLPRSDGPGIPTS